LGGLWALNRWGMGDKGGNFPPEGGPPRSFFGKRLFLAFWGGATPPKRFFKTSGGGKINNAPQKNPPLFPKEEDLPTPPFWGAHISRGGKTPPPGGRELSPLHTREVFSFLSKKKNTPPPPYKYIPHRGGFSPPISLKISPPPLLRYKG